MLSIAYRMVGSFSEAEDLVQEAFLRLHQAGDVANTKAWLTTVLTRLCIDHLRAADAAFYGDGGGKAPSVGILRGRDRIAAVLAGFGRVGTRRDVRIELTE